MRLVDADAFIAKLDHVPMVQEAIRKAMDTMPTIEQPEIIRCKDCKWFNDIGCAIRIVDDTDKLSENDYCSFAERRTDERT